MKNLGVLILAVGVAVSAAFGARLSPAMHEQMVLKGRAQFREAAEQAKREAYCEARRGAGLAQADGCTHGEAATEAAGSVAARVAQACEGRGGSSRSISQIVTAERARLRGLRAAGGELPPPVAEARRAWLDAMEAAIEPAARAATLRPPSPERRLSGWFGQNGVFFLLGLVLVVAGAVIGRVAVAREARRDESVSDGGPHRGGPAVADLGHLLEGLAHDVESLAGEMKETESPTSEDFQRLKEAVHELTREKIEPIVSAGTKVQARYGVSTFAAIFGPFSSGERLVNRAWSALVDRHWPEATHSLAAAVEHLTRAGRLLEEAAGEQAG